MASIILTQQAEKFLKRQHPWVFSGAIARGEGSPQPGETVEILTADGAWWGRGACSPQSQIAARIWTFTQDEAVDPSFFRARLQRAIDSRQWLTAGQPRVACRLVNAESDGLPGLIVDRYADFLVCQFLSAGAEYWKPTLVAHLKELVPAAGIYERSDAQVRAKEGLPLCAGVLAGLEPPDLVEIQEDLYRFAVDLKRGQKTGFYLDQRENRVCAAQYSSGAEVLNCFAYTGAFGIPALKAGASRVINLESSGAALELVQPQIERNGIIPERVENVEGDAFTLLRRYRDSRRQFDLIILDPPKFAESRHQVPGASRGYKDINLLSFKLLRPGGILFTFSCSGLVEPDLFQKIVADAALDAGHQVQILRWLTQPPDHPCGLNFPEGRYLKGLVCRVV